MAWANPNPSERQKRNQPSSYPSTSRHVEDFRVTKQWHADRVGDAAARPGEHRAPSRARPGG